MSRAVVPGAAERCGRALPEERKTLPAGGRSGRCGAVRLAGASQSAHWLRANRTLRHGPRAHHGSRCWALDDSSADVGFSAGWLGADAALPGL